MKTINRRSFLNIVGAGAGGLVLGGLFPKTALGQAATKRKFVFAYFEGGWDLLLGLDPHDPATTNAMAHQIDPNYGALPAQYRSRGVQTRGELRFGPAVPPALLAHAQDITVVKGINMDTAAHEVGRRYFITGQFPRGLAAVGSSVPSEIIAQVGENAPIPNLSAGVEAYSRGLPGYASALGVNSLTDLIVALQPFVAVDPTIIRAVEAFQDEPLGCAAKGLDREGLSSRLLQSQQRARDWIESRLASNFDIYGSAMNPLTPEMAALRALYGVDTTGGAPDSPEVLALAAGQALKQNISQCVSVTMARDLDTHSNWAQDQAPRQERGWQALAALITDLKATPSKDNPQRSMLEETTILAFSEFGRTPLFNNIQGRDHFLGNCCLLAGAGIKRGKTIGDSAEIGMMPLETELSSGRGVVAPPQARRDSGEVVTMSPKHVLATVLASAGLSAEYLRAPALQPLLA